MSLTKQVVPVFIQGLSEKSPKGMSIAGELEQAINFYAVKGTQAGFELRKRFGTKALSQLTSTGATISSARKVFPYNNELILETADTTYSWDSAVGNWVAKGYPSTTTVTTDTVTPHQSDQANVDSLVYKGISVTCWQEGGNAWATVKDAATGSALITTSLGPSSAGGTHCRIVGAANNVWVFWNQGSAGKIKVALFQVATPTASPAIGDAIIDSNNTFFDARYYADGTTTCVQIAYVNSIGRLCLAQWNAVSGGVGASILSNTCNQPVAILQQDDNNADANFRTAFGDGVNVYVVTAPGTLAAIGAPITVDNSAFATGYANITGVTIAGAPSVWYEHRFGSPTTYYTSTYRANGILAQGSMGIASRAFFAPNGHVCMLGVYDSPLQATYFLLDFTNGQIIAKSLPNVAGGLSTNQGQTAQAAIVSGSMFQVGTLQKTQVIATAGVVSAVRSACTLTLNFNDTTIGRPAMTGQQLLIPGGQPQIYDSATISEWGFNVSAEAPQVFTVVGAGGLTTGATYGYVVVYAWQDAKGNVHRSAPIGFSNVVMSGGTTTAGLTVPTYRATGSISPKTGIVIEIYRTQANLTNYTLLASIANNTAVAFASYTDAASDATIAGNAQLYTTGNVLQGLPPPSCRVSAVHKNRLFVAGCEKSNEIWVSKEFSPGVGIAFSDSIVVRIPSSAGPVVALQAMDGNLLAFTTTSTWAIAGEFPDATGAGFPVPIAQRLPINAGCIAAESLCLGPSGVYFQGAQGIWLIDRGLNASYVGAQVEDDVVAISGSIAVDAVNQIRFAQASGSMLVWDQYFQRWYEYAYPWGQISCCLWQGSQAFVDASGAVHVETGLYDDSGSPVISTVSFSFLSFAQLQGFQRVYRFQVFGRYVGTHGFTAKVGYDHVPQPVESFSISNVDPTLGIYAYGGDSLFGGEAIYGMGVVAPWRFEVKPSRPKCTAIALTITDSFPLSVASGGFAICSVGFEIGILPGLGRMPAALRIPPS